MARVSGTGSMVPSSLGIDDQYKVLCCTVTEKMEARLVYSWCQREGEMAFLNYLLREVVTEKVTC